MKKIVLLFFCCCILSSCIALPISHNHITSLTIQGRVVSENGAAIEGATIKLTNSYSEKQIQNKTSSENGEFEIGPITERAEKYVIWFGPASEACVAVIEVEALGYKTFTQKYTMLGPAGLSGCSKKPVKVEIKLEKAI